MAFQINRVKEFDNDNFVNMYERIDKRTLSDGDILQYDASINRWVNRQLDLENGSDIVQSKGFLVYSLGVEITLPRNGILKNWVDWGENPIWYIDDEQFDLETGEWTCPKTGWYEVSAHVGVYWQHEDERPALVSLDLQVQDPIDDNLFSPVVTAQKDVNHETFDCLDIHIPKYYFIEGKKAYLLGRYREHPISESEGGTLSIGYALAYETGGSSSWFSIVSRN